MKKNFFFLCAIAFFQLVPSTSRGGGFFFGVGNGPFFFSHHRDRGFGFFLHSGPRWMPGAGGSGYASAVVVPPVRNSGASYGEGDSLSVNGYRVAPSGWLRVSVEPLDAEVFVDGFPIALDQTGRTRTVGFLIGPHHVRVHRGGFRAYESEVEIQQARESFLQVKLVRE